VNQLSPQLLQRTGRRFSGIPSSSISTCISHLGQTNCTLASLNYYYFFSTVNLRTCCTLTGQWRVENTLV
jgi:hypothetical protein